jgi:hypothetical protein
MKTTESSSLTVYTALVICMAANMLETCVSWSQDKLKDKYEQAEIQTKLQRLEKLEHMINSSTPQITPMIQSVATDNTKSIMTTTADTVVQLSINDLRQAGIHITTKNTSGDVYMMNDSERHHNKKSLPRVDTIYHAPDMGLPTLGMK